MSDKKKELTKEQFAANEIKAFCEYVMHPDSDLHKDADEWIKERLQANTPEQEPTEAFGIGAVSKRYSEKDMDDAYDKGFKNGVNSYNNIL